MRILLTVGLLAATNHAFCSDKATEKYIKDNLRYLTETASDIPMSIVIGQAILESDRGKSRVAKELNNHFGLRIFDKKKRKYIYLSFKSKKECFAEHTKRLKNPRYRECFANRNFEDWADKLRKCGYCPEASYPARLKKVIKTYKLHERFDGNNFAKIRRKKSI